MYSAELERNLFLMINFPRAGSQPFMGGEAHAGMAIGAENILAKVGAALQLSCDLVDSFIYAPYLLPPNWWHQFIWIITSLPFRLRNTWLPHWQENPIFHFWSLVTLLVGCVQNRMLIIIFLFPHRWPGAGLAQLVTAQLLEGPEASLVSGAKVRNIRMSKWLARHNMGW